MKSRRYNADKETSKQFYARRKKEMEDYFNHPYYKTYSEKIWADYKKANK